MALLCVIVFSAQISTLEILNLEDQGALLSDDEIFASRQTGKHTCMALRRYFEAHLAIKVEQVKQSLQRTEGGLPIHPPPPYKVSRSHHVVFFSSSFVTAHFSYFFYKLDVDVQPSIFQLYCIL